MKLSIVELGTVAPGTTEKDALADALENTRRAERLGYHRVWFAEHHLSPDPPVVLGNRRFSSGVCLIRDVGVTGRPVFLRCVHCRGSWGCASSAGVVRSLRVSGVRWRWSRAAPSRFRRPSCVVGAG
mgnify:CR=1 FL=1